MLADPAAASADELRAVWGPFVGEAGTFDLSGNVVTMQALVAKNPSRPYGPSAATKRLQLIERRRRHA
jgi:hypothetical protein